MLQIAQCLFSSTHGLSGSILPQMEHARADNEDEVTRQQAREGRGLI